MSSSGDDIFIGGGGASDDTPTGATSSSGDPSGSSDSCPEGEETGGSSSTEGTDEGSTIDSYDAEGDADTYSEVGTDSGGDEEEEGEEREDSGDGDEDEEEEEEEDDEESDLGGEIKPRKLLKSINIYNKFLEEFNESMESGKDKRFVNMSKKAFKALENLEPNTIPSCISALVQAPVLCKIKDIIEFIRLQPPESASIPRAVAVLCKSISSVSKFDPQGSKVIQDDIVEVLLAIVKLTKVCYKSSYSFDPDSPGLDVVGSVLDFGVENEEDEDSDGMEIDMESVREYDKWPWLVTVAECIFGSISADALEYIFTRLVAALAPSADWRARLCLLVYFRGALASFVCVSVERYLLDKMLDIAADMVDDVDGSVRSYTWGLVLMVAKLGSSILQEGDISRIVSLVIDAFQQGTMPTPMMLEIFRCLTLTSIRSSPQHDTISKFLDEHTSSITTFPELLAAETIIHGISSDFKYAPCNNIADFVIAIFDALGGKEFSVDKIESHSTNKLLKTPHILALITRASVLDDIDGVFSEIDAMFMSIPDDELSAIVQSVFSPFLSCIVTDMDTYQAKTTEPNTFLVKCYHAFLEAYDLPNAKQDLSSCSYDPPTAIAHFLNFLFNAFAHKPTAFTNAQSDILYKMLSAILLNVTSFVLLQGLSFPSVYKAILHSSFATQTAQQHERRLLLAKGVEATAALSSYISSGDDDEDDEDEFPVGLEEVEVGGITFSVEKVNGSHLILKRGFDTCLKLLTASVKYGVVDYTTSKKMILGVIEDIVNILDKNKTIGLLYARKAFLHISRLLMSAKVSIEEYKDVMRRVSKIYIRHIKTQISFVNLVPIQAALSDTLGEYFSDRSLPGSVALFDQWESFSTIKKTFSSTSAVLSTPQLKHTRKCNTRYYDAFVELIISPTRAHMSSHGVGHLAPLLYVFDFNPSMEVYPPFILGELEQLEKVSDKEYSLLWYVPGVIQHNIRAVKLSLFPTSVGPKGADEYLEACCVMAKRPRVLTCPFVDFFVASGVSLVKYYGLMLAESKVLKDEGEEIANAGTVEKNTEPERDLLIAKMARAVGVIVRALWVELYDSIFINVFKLLCSLGDTNLSEVIKELDEGDFHILLQEIAQVYGSGLVVGRVAKDEALLKEKLTMICEVKKDAVVSLVGHWEFKHLVPILKYIGIDLDA